jgi:excisionase family DNA binding protein
MTQQLLTREDLAERWKCTDRTIDNMRGNGLPAVRIGRAVRFRPAEVEEWLDSQRDVLASSGGAA